MLRDGKAVAPEYLMKEIKSTSVLVFSVNSICQVAIVSIRYCFCSEIGKLYQEKRDYFRQLLKGSRFELMPCEGTYFQVASYAAISNENDVDFANDLLRNMAWLSYFYFFMPMEKT
jgi:methionine aminotransferase